MVAKIIRKGISIFFEYDTPKIVHIQSKKVGIINRLIQLGIISYIILFAIVYKKGYQEFENVVSAVTTKVKGVVLTNLTDVPGISGERIWDVADYVQPAQQNGAFFIMTNMVVTPNQTQGTCDEDPHMKDIVCKSDADCPRNTVVVNGNGVRTGKCVNSTQNHTLSVCEIYAWCPVEVDVTPKPAILSGSKEFTVLIKNSIDFPKFKVKRRNILATSNGTYLKSCMYNVVTDPYCPIFKLDYIVSQMSGQNYDEMSIKGGVISIGITWNCNLDFDESECKPVYTFKRLDDPNTKISQGWNFRFADNFDNNNGVRTRTLTKAFGILFVISVYGKAGQFRIVPLVMNIGTGLALLSLATVMCDIVVLYILKYRQFYKEQKYQYVKGDDAFEIVENLSGDDDEAPQRSPRAKKRRSLKNGDDDECLLNG